MSCPPIQKMSRMSKLPLTVNHPVETVVQYEQDTFESDSHFYTSNTIQIISNSFQYFYFCFRLYVRAKGHPLMMSALGRGGVEKSKKGFRG